MRKLLGWIISVAVLLFLVFNFNRIFPRVDTSTMKPGLAKEAMENVNWARDVVTRVTTTVWHSVKPKIGYTEDEMKDGALDYTKKTLDNTKEVIDEKTKEAEKRQEEKKKKEKEKKAEDGTKDKKTSSSKK